jgi:transposase
MLFVGVDWGERHHDLCLLDEAGQVLATHRIADGLAGVGKLHALVATQAEDPTQVAVGIETDRGLLVGALLAAGYQVYAVNPQVVSHYRGRHGGARAKSDRGDAKVLADLVRTDRRNHRQVAGDSPLVETVKVLARAHQSLIWARQRHVNALRVAEQPGRWPVHAGSGTPAMPVPPLRDYAGETDFCSSSEGSVEATRRHAWGCWA